MRGPKELTARAVVLGVVLAVVMGGANAYLGLKAGQTVSACIPAAVISMAVLRRFKDSTILENNLVQTIASAGETVAAALAFTLPALIFMGESLSWGLTFATSALGGCLGVCFSIPLRRVLIVDMNMPFPEGVATAEILKAGATESTEKTSPKTLILSSLASFVFSIAQTGMHVVGGHLQGGIQLGKMVWAGGLEFSSALLASGYLIGWSSFLPIVIGALFAWIVLVPVLGLVFGLSEGSAFQAATSLWSAKARPIGVGVMIVGGLETLKRLVPPIKKAFSARNAKNVGFEKDLPFSVVLATLLSVSFISWGFAAFAFSSVLSGWALAAASGAVVALLLVVSALCAVIAGYSVGLAGATALPISALVVVSILALSGPVCAFVGAKLAAPILVVLASFVACVAAMSGDNLQDLKAGHMVGATPWKQQLLLAVGVVTSALVMAQTMNLLFNAYGFGAVLPRAGMDPTQALACPKGVMIASLVQSLCAQGDLTLFKVGMAAGAALFVLNELFSFFGSTRRVPILGLALGIYFPLSIVTAVGLGAWIRSRVETTGPASHDSVLLAAGLVAGESMCGVLLAVPFMMSQSTNLFAVSGVPHAVQKALGLACIVGFGWALHRFGKIRPCLTKPFMKK